MIKPEVYKIADKYIEQGGNCTKAVKEVRPDLKPLSAKNKAGRLLSNATFREIVEEACFKSGLTADFIIQELMAGISKRDKHHPTYLNQGERILGLEAPTKTENKTSLDATITQQEAENIALIVQRSRIEALNN